MEWKDIIALGALGLSLYNTYHAREKDKRDAKKEKDSAESKKISKAEEDFITSFKANIGYGTRKDAATQALRDGLAPERIERLMVPLLLEYNKNPEESTRIARETREFAEKFIAESKKV